MVYPTLLNAADAAVQQYMQKGITFRPGDTICAILSNTQHIYTGVNHAQMQNGLLNNIHAEIEAIQNMYAEENAAVEFLFLMDILSHQPMFPCGNCIQYLITRYQSNMNCQVVFPDRTVPIMQTNNHSSPTHSMQFPVNSVQAPVHSMQFQPRQSVQVSVMMPVSSQLPTNGIKAQNGQADYLKNRVSALMNAADDVEEEEQPAKKKKGLFGNLFRKD